MLSAIKLSRCCDCVLKENSLCIICLRGCDGYDLKPDTSKKERTPKEKAIIKANSTIPHKKKPKSVRKKLISEIKRKMKSMSIKDIADEYNIESSTLYRIRAGDIWRSVE